jgi:hypothetical protein
MLDTGANPSFDYEVRAFVETEVEILARPVMQILFSVLSVAYRAREIESGVFEQGV